MLPLVGFIDANDPRMRSTIDAIRRGLTDGPQGSPGQPLDVGCCQTGEACQRRRAAAEMADPATGELIGNIPQAFSHVGLINTAWPLSCVRQRDPAP